MWAASPYILRTWYLSSTLITSFTFYTHFKQFWSYISPLLSILIDKQILKLCIYTIVLEWSNSWGCVHVARAFSFICTVMARDRHNQSFILHLLCQLSVAITHNQHNPRTCTLNKLNLPTLSQQQHNGNESIRTTCPHCIVELYLPNWSVSPTYLSPCPPAAKVQRNFHQHMHRDLNGFALCCNHDSLWMSAM